MDAKLLSFSAKRCFWCFTFGCADSHEALIASVEPEDWWAAYQDILAVRNDVNIKHWHRTHRDRMRQIRRESARRVRFYTHEYRYEARRAQSEQLVEQVAVTTKEITEFWKVHWFMLYFLPDFFTAMLAADELMQKRPEELSYEEQVIKAHYRKFASTMPAWQAYQKAVDELALTKRRLIWF